MQNGTVNWLDLSGIAALIIAVITLYRTIKTTPGDVSASEADTVAKYEEAATKAVERALKLEKRLKTIEGELEEAKQELQKQAEQMLLLVAERDDLKDWAERLVHQVQSLGVQPVKIRERPSRPRPDSSDHLGQDKEILK